LTLSAALGVACGGNEFSNAPVDAGSEKAAADTGSGDDTTSDAPSDAAADWCAVHQGNRVFCDDFSETNLPGNFDAIDHLNGGSLQLSETDYASPPRSLFATTPALANPYETAHASLSRSFNVSGPHFFFELAAKLDEASCFAGNDDDPVTLAFVAFERATPWAYGIALLFGASGDAALEVKAVGDAAPSFAAHPLQSKLPRGIWTRIQIEAHLALTSPTLDVMADGIVLLKDEPLSAVPQNLREPAIVVGVQTTNIVSKSQGCQAGVDNVLFDVTP
jgi:hypothetical protein